MVFSTQESPTSGRITLSGTLTVSDPDNPYIETYSGSTVNPTTPAFFTVVFDTRYCTYTIGGGATVLARVSGGPVSSDATALSLGGIHFKDQRIDPAAAATRTIEVNCADAPFVHRLQTARAGGSLP